MEYFTIADKHYLAVANLLDKTTFRLNSAIYQWDGTHFIVVQNIPTLGAISFNSFKILSDMFLVVTNTNNDTTRSVDSIIYKWGENQFNRFQEIRTEGAMASTTRRLQQKLKLFLFLQTSRVILPSPLRTSGQVTAL